jgi:hypothetical protein
MDGINTVEYDFGLADEQESTRRKSRNSAVNADSSGNRLHGSLW